MLAFHSWLEHPHVGEMFARCDGGRNGRVEEAMSASDPARDGMFSEALAYERFMGRWSRQLAPLVARFAGVRDGETLLDVGSGTGALSAALLTAAPAGHIVGVDPSASYVSVAQASLAGPHVQFKSATLGTWSLQTRRSTARSRCSSSISSRTRIRP